MQTIKYHLSVRAQHDEENDHAYIVVAFVEAMRELLKAKAVTTVRENTESVWCCLVGYKGKLYQMESDFNISSTARGFDAIGCGDAYALGAMIALKDLEPIQRIMQTLAISGELCALVASPYYVETL